MASSVLGAKSQLPASLKDGKHSRIKTLTTAFEKELGYLLAYLKRGSEDEQFSQTSSNALFNLWCQYENKLPNFYFTEKLLSVGDLLLQRAHYGNARNHCYGRYLEKHHDKSQSLQEAVANDKEKASPLLRAMLGDCICQYHLIRQQDAKLMLVRSLNTVKELLKSLQQISQAGLSREPLYWLVYNTLVHMFSICRPLLCAHPELVIEYLVWGGVCMESSVPLMASKYLSLRVNFYTAVCQCYNNLKQPNKAEAFARRSLEKVHELAQLEGVSSSCFDNEEAFKEASIKLSVMVFKRSVFASRKKLRSAFRSKVRPSLRELLQIPSPRSATEKLLAEMLTGASAHFLAVLETISDVYKRPLDKGPPVSPLDTDLDNETITDIYQELFCYGVDLALSALEAGVETGSLLSCAINGGNGIPLENLVDFVRAGYLCEQKDLVELLAVKLVNITQVCSNPIAVTKGKTLELVLMMDSLKFVFKRYKNILNTLPTPNPPSTANTGSALAPTLSEIKEETNITADELFSKLLESLSLLHLCTPSLLSTDYDLLLDCTVLVWEVASPAFSLIHSHDYTACKQFIHHPSGNQYVVFLTQLVEICQSLELWRIDPLLYGELCLKLSCLYEARATRRGSSNENFVLLYDRSLLLECQSELKRDVASIEKARATENTEQLEILHSEFIFTLTRVKLKLASTLPPPCAPESTSKPSSLKSKVAERKDRELQRAKLLSVLTAATVSVPGVSELRQHCGDSHYKLAVLTMLQASVEPMPDITTRQTLLEECFNQLNKDPIKPKSMSSTGSLPAPILLHASDTSLQFQPSSFTDPALQSRVVYYKLFGREATGSSRKVRQADKNLPGLGIEVLAGTPLIVSGLEANKQYVFSVAAYTVLGELIGGSTGDSTPPITASYTFPLLPLWGHFCKCAFECGVHYLAMRACEKLWSEFVAPDNTLNQESLSEAHSSLLRLFIQSVFIWVQLKISEGSLMMDKLSAEGPLKLSQQSRLDLAQRLMLAMDVSAGLNDCSLCVQAAVMAYGVLAPLIQYNIECQSLYELLLKCYVVICETPDQINNHTPAQHHMISVMSYYLGKVAVEQGKKGLFTMLTDSARALLITSMPVIAKPNEVPKEPSGLAQASLLSGSQHPSMASHTTLSSGLPSLLPQTGANKKKKSKAKKLANSVDEISEDSKSSEFKNFEGFLLSNVQSVSDGFDLTGQEDPVLLHAVIATQTSTNAHKEVLKFKRRPQYLEYFVHLSNATMSKGHVEKVLEWCKDAFSWLTRRNEILLSTRSSMVSGPAPKQEKQGSKTPRRGSRAVSAVPSSTHTSGGKKRTNPLNSSLNLTAKRGTKFVTNQQSGMNIDGTLLLQPPPEVPNCASSMNVAALKRAKGLLSRKITGAALAKLSPNKMRRLQPTVGKELEADIKITRDDLEAKAIAVIITYLPYIWRKHRARKRLRSVCKLELPWRAQANLVQALCQFELIKKRLQSMTSETSVMSPLLTLDRTGVIIEEAIPVHKRAIAGKNAEVFHVADASSSPVMVLTELISMMQVYQHAITLAHRGFHWILLQNISRSLLNTLNCLTESISCLPQGNEQTTLLAAVYGEALKPLYSSVCGLLDMLLNSGVSACGCLFPVAPSLKYTPVLDECDCVGVCVIKQLVLLTVHVLYTHQHWEKVVSIIVKFDDITNHSWADELVPILKSSQDQLSTRLETNKQSLKRVKIDPAAHLDPGPDGYNVYNGVGHSLGMTTVPLDTAESSSRTGQGTRGELSRARRMRWLCVGGLGGSLPLSDVLSAYDQAINLLGSKGDSELLAQAMNELGDLTVDLSTSPSSSGQWWMESLCLLLGTREPLQLAHISLDSTGLWGCLLAAQIAHKLARYVHTEELDTRLAFALLCSLCIKTALSFSLPTPVNDLDYIHHSSLCNPFPGVELLSDHHRLSPQGLLSSLSWVCQELITRSHYTTVLPCVWFYHYIASTVCRDTRHTVLARILRLQSLTGLYDYREALLTLSELLSGTDIQQGSHSADDKHSEIHWSLHRFANSLPLSDPKNLKCIQYIAGKSLSKSLRKLYGEFNVSLLSIAQAQLFTALAGSITALHFTPVVSRHRGGTPLPSESRPSSRMSTSSQASTVSLGSQCGSPRSSLPSSVRRRSRLQDTKHFLSEHAEKLLAPLCEADDHPGTKIHAIIELSRVAMVYRHASTGVQLSLAAVRTMQASEECYDPRLWLEAVASLARALVGCQYRGVLDCEEVCETGIDQSVTLGEGEMAALLNHTAARHCMTQVPQNISKITKYCQDGLELIEKVPVLSPSCSLLQCELTLLLAEVSSVTGVADSQMVTVYNGLLEMIRKQGSGDSEDLNMYSPQPLLMATVCARLTHTLCLLGEQPDRALSCCREGLSWLQRSAQQDVSLTAELLTHQGWLLSVFDEQAAVSSLIEATNTIAECGLHPRMAASSLYKLAELWTDKVAARQSHRDTHHGKHHDSNVKNYGSWLLLKMAAKISSNGNAIEEFISQVNNAEAMKLLTTKQVNDLPDFIVLDLCGSYEQVLSLASSVEVPSISALQPSTQSVNNSGLSLFKVASYYHTLLLQCSWQKPSLNLGGSNWNLHHHTLTQDLYPKVKALLDYLMAYSQYFKSVRIPAVPGTLVSNKHFLSIDPLISASDNELSVIWRSPHFLDSSDSVIGYFALNKHAVRTQTTDSSPLTPGQTFDMFTVRMPLQLLEEIHQVWSELAELTSAYVDSRSSSRPVSRSPTKQKKSVKMPVEILDKCSQAVDRLKEALQVTKSESPKFELSVVSSVARLLKPYSQTTVKGEAYHFFRALFS